MVAVFKRSSRAEQKTFEANLTPEPQAMYLSSKTLNMLPNSFENK